MKAEGDDEAALGARKVTVYFQARNGQVRTERTYGTPSEVHGRWDKRRGTPLMVREGWHGAA